MKATIGDYSYDTDRDQYRGTAESFSPLHWSEDLYYNAEADVYYLHGYGRDADAYGYDYAYDEDGYYITPMSWEDTLMWIETYLPELHREMWGDSEE